MHKLSEEAFELDLMKSCQEELGFELFDATSEVVGGDSSTFGRQSTQEVLLSKNLRNALVKLNPNLRSFNALIPSITGTAKKKVNSAAATRDTPISRAPIMVAPERDVPGTMEST